MKVLDSLDQTKTIRKLSLQEAELGQRIFQINLNYQPGEDILIVTDTLLYQHEAAIWFETAKNLPGHPAVKMLILEGMTRSGEEPPAEVIEACQQAAISLLHTTYSLTHTQAGKAVVNSQRRGFSLPGVRSELMNRTLNIDYSPIKTLSDRLQKVLQENQTLHISSQHGTDITTGIRQNKVLADTGFLQSGEIGNLPAGEVFFAPLDETTNGVWVVNGSIADFEGTGLDESIKIEIAAGMAVKITGGQSAARLQEALDEVGPQAYHVAEIGLGTNPSANPHGELIEAEKAYATAHLALGNSSSMGGSVNVPIHLDGVTLDVEIQAKTANKTLPILTKNNYRI